MGNIILVAETGADIPVQLVQRYNIQTVPMHVAFGDETKDDGTFPPEDICAYYERTGTLPKTSASTPEDFTAVFDRIETQWPEAQILYLAYSSVTTCSYQSAQLAAEGRSRITSLDTKMVSAGQCAVVVRVARLLEAHPEWTVEQAVGAVRDLIGRVRMCFIPKDMEYLRAGGRVSNAAALCGKLLGIHPLIEILDGKLVATRKLRGRLKAIAPKLAVSFAAENRLEKDELWLIWSPGLPEETKAAAEQAARAQGYENIVWIKTGGVITTHGGPGCFGVVGFAEA